MLARLLARRQPHAGRPAPEEIRYLRARPSRLDARDKDSREHHRWERAQDSKCRQGGLDLDTHRVGDTQGRAQAAGQGN